MHMHREKGNVAMIRSTETKASRRAQQPGPSGSAETQKKEQSVSGALLNILPLRARGIAYAQGVTGILHSKSRGIIPLKAIIAYRN